MKLFKAVFQVFILSGALFMASCSSTNSGESPTMQLKFNTNTNSSTLAKVSEASVANSLVFDSGSITLSEIQFEVETEDSDSIEIDVEIEQNVTIDFATGETTPDMSHLVLPVGTFEESSVELELFDGGETPAVYLEGTFTDSLNQSHPIRFEFNSGETFEVEREGQVIFDSEMNVIAEVTFDPIAWFAGVSLSMLEEAEKDNEGVIVVSESSNTAIFEIVEEGLDLATEIEIEL